MKNPNSQVSRRSFLTRVAQGSLATAAAVTIGQFVRFLSFEPPATQATTFSVGQPESYQRDELVYVAEARVYIGRDAQGLYALDAVCTHLGCLVEVGEESGFVCPCHGTRFDREGRALTGPATKPLRHLQLRLDPQTAQLTVDRAAAVEATVRLSI